MVFYLLCFLKTFLCCRNVALVGEFNKQRKMIDKMAIQIAKHTVEITERDVVIDTLKSMVPQQEDTILLEEE